MGFLNRFSAFPDVIFINNFFHGTICPGRPVKNKKCFSFFDFGITIGIGIGIEVGMT